MEVSSAEMRKRGGRRPPDQAGPSTTFDNTSLIYGGGGVGSVGGLSSPEMTQPAEGGAIKRYLNAIETLTACFEGNSIGTITVSSLAFNAARRPQQRVPVPPSTSNKSSDTVTDVSPLLTKIRSAVIRSILYCHLFLHIGLIAKHQRPQRWQGVRSKG
jgi:hypothetical protein